MAGATLTTVNNILKEIYQGQIRDQLQSEVIGLKRVEQTSRGVESTVGGKYVTFPLRVTRNQGIGYRAENAALPAAGSQGYQRVTVGLKYGYGRTSFTGQTMRLAKTNPQSFANAMQREMDGLKSDIQKDSARIFYGDGSGKIAVGTATNSTTTLKSTTGSGVMYAQLGMEVDVYSAAHARLNPAAPTITKVSGVNPTTGVITFDQTLSADPGVGGYMVRSGTPVGAGVFPEPNGLASIVASTGALQGLDPATVPIWAATTKAMGGNLAEIEMIKMVDAIRLLGSKVTLILTSLGVRREYWKLLTTNQRRYVEQRNFDGGYVGLAFNSGYEIPLVEDVDCPAGTMYFLNEPSFTVYRDEDWHWIDDEGDVLKWVVNYDAFECVLAKYWELGVDRRNANGVITGITES